VKATIAATVARIGGLADHRSFGRIVEASSFDDLDLELGSAEIDADHDGKQVGEIVHAELSPEGRLAVVGVLDEGDWLAEVEQPLFLSGTWEMRGDVRHRCYVAREAQLLGVSLTLSPANLDAQPLSWRPGDVRSESDRRSWPISWSSSSPLLKRAVDSWSAVGLLELRHRTASRIVDRRDKSDGFPMPREGSWLAPGAYESLELGGGLRKSAFRGKILRVS
jgi:hypothetical protein